MFLLRSHGVRELFSSSGFRCLLQYSTSAASEPPSQTNFMVNYLINSLGFSMKEAISASTKVSQLKSTENSDSVLIFLNQCGFDKIQIRNIVSSVPEILLRNADKILEPKFRVLQELGLSGSDLVNLIKNHPRLVTRGLNSSLMPTISYLRKVLGSDEKVVKAINRSAWLLSSSLLNKIQPNVLLLQSYGFSNKSIEKLIVRQPTVIIQKSELLEEKLNRVEVELGIPRNSAMFSYGVCALASVSKSNLEMKFGIFRSFGWSDSDIYSMARSNPLCLKLSGAKIRKMLKFYMKELGYTPAYLASHATLIFRSLEKRVVPRNEVLKILKEKKLVKQTLCLCTVVTRQESKFVHDYVIPYKTEIPDLYETYTIYKGQQQNTK